MKALDKNIEIVDLGLWIPKERALVIADLHLGYEEEQHSQGVLVPRMNFNDIRKRLEENIFNALEKKDGRKFGGLEKRSGGIGTIVINGDLKHEFGRISEQEWKEVLDMLEFLQKHCRRIVLVQGNHDNILGPIANWKNLKVEKEFYLPKEKILIAHGNREPEGRSLKKAETIVIAHEHPAVSLRDGAKAEKYKCFLKGKWKGKKVIVMPSLLSLTEGTDVLKENLLSPMLQGNLQEFEAWLVEDKVYYFGRLKDLL